MSRRRDDQSSTPKVKPDTDTGEYVYDRLWRKYKEFQKTAKKCSGQVSNFEDVKKRDVQCISTQVQPKNSKSSVTDECVFNRPWRQSKKFPKRASNSSRQMFDTEEKVDVKQRDEESPAACAKPVVVSDATIEAREMKKNVRKSIGQVSGIQEVLEEPEKDGTELDFNVSVYSQDEADSEDTSTSCFMKRNNCTPYITLPVQDVGKGSSLMPYISSPAGISQDPKQPVSKERVLSVDSKDSLSCYSSLQFESNNRDPRLQSYMSGKRHYFVPVSKDFTGEKQKNAIQTTTSEDYIPLEENKANDRVSVLSSVWKNEPGPSKSKHDSKRSRNMYRKPFTKKEKQKVDLEEKVKRKSHYCPESPSYDSTTAVKKVHYNNDAELYVANKYGDNSRRDRKGSTSTSLNTAPEVPVPTWKEVSTSLLNLQNYASDEDCFFHLSVDSDRSTSPKLVMEKKESQGIVTSSHNSEKSKYTTCFEIWRNEASPSQIKVDSKSKKEKYIKSVTKSKMQDSPFEEETNRGCSQTARLPSCDLHLPWRSASQANSDDSVDKETKFRDIYKQTTENRVQVTDQTPQGTKVLKFDRRPSHLQSWRSGARSSSDMGSYTGQIFKPAYDDSELATKDYSPGFIDSHCHLDFLFQRIFHLGSFRTYRLKCRTTDPFPVSFEGCVSVFCEPWTFRKVSWWEDLLSDPDIWGAFGCHPHYVSRFQIAEESFLKHALLHSKVVALGEIGLDYSERNKECKDLQQKAFRKQLEIALEFKKPLVIHCRDAHADCISILKEMVPHDYIIHRHCFTDSWEEAQEWLSSFCNLFLGFTGLVTQTNRRARMVQDVVRKVPLEKILLETDAPYFRPNGIGYSHPGMAIHVAAQIAYIKNLDIQVVLKHARENTKKMYGI